MGSENSPKYDALGWSLRLAAPGKKQVRATISCSNWKDQIGWRGLAPPVAQSGVRVYPFTPHLRPSLAVLDRSVFPLPGLSFRYGEIFLTPTGGSQIVRATGLVEGSGDGKRLSDIWSALCAKTSVTDPVRSDLANLVHLCRQHHFGPFPWGSPRFTLGSER